MTDYQDAGYSSFMERNPLLSTPDSFPTADLSGILEDSAIGPVKTTRGSFEATVGENADYGTIQQAINSGAKRIFVKSGIYYINSDITIPSGTIIYSQDKENTILDFGNSSYAMRASGVTRGLENSMYQQSVLEINVTYNSKSIDLISWGVPTTLQDIGVTVGDYLTYSNQGNISIYKIASIESGSSATLDSVYQGTFTGYLPQFMFRNLLFDIHIEGFTFRNSSDYVISFLDVYRGSAKDCVFTNCGGLKVIDSDLFSVENNRFSEVTTNIPLYIGGASNRIKNNVISNCSGITWGMYVGGDRMCGYIYNPRSGYNIVKDNNICDINNTVSTKSIGIKIESLYSIAENNTITNTRGSGILVSASNFKVTRNNFGKNNFSKTAVDIEVNGMSGVITDNISYYSDTAIAVTSVLSNSVVSNNTIYLCTGNGIYIPSPNGNTITNNSITTDQDSRSYPYGIYLGYGTNNVVSCNSLPRSSGYYGIYLTGYNNVVSNNTGGSSWCFIECQGTRNSITGNVIDNTARGIKIATSDGDSNVISGNTTWGCDYGIDISMSTCVGNLVTSNITVGSTKAGLNDAGTSTTKADNIFN